MFIILYFGKLGGIFFVLRKFRRFKKRGEISKILFIIKKKNVNKINSKFVCIIILGIILILIFIL